MGSYKENVNNQKGLVGEEFRTVSIFEVKVLRFGVAYT